MYKNLILLFFYPLWVKEGEYKTFLKNIVFYLKNGENSFFKCDVPDIFCKYLKNQHISKCLAQSFLLFYMIKNTFNYHIDQLISQKMKLSLFSNNIFCS